MPRKFQNGQYKCFPGHGPDEALPRKIPINEIKIKVDAICDEIAKKIDEWFAGTSHIGTHRKNRGKIASLRDDLHANVFVSADHTELDEITTYGQLRNVTKKMRETLRAATIGHEKFRDRRMNREVVNALYTAFDKEREAFVRELESLPPAVTPTAMSNPREIHTPKRAGIPSRNTSAQLVESEEERRLRDARLQDLIARQNNLRPHEVLEVLNTVGEALHRADMHERQFVELKGLTWYIYRMWRDDRVLYETAANVLQHIQDYSCLPTGVRIDRLVMKIIMRTLQMDHPDQDDLEDFLQTVGLYGRYRHGSQKPKKKKKVATEGWQQNGRETIKRKKPAVRQEQEIPTKIVPTIVEVVRDPFVIDARTTFMDIRWRAIRLLQAGIKPNITDDLLALQDAKIRTLQKQ